MELLQIKLLKPTAKTKTKSIALTETAHLLEWKLHLFLTYKEPCVWMILNTNNMHYSVENIMSRADIGPNSEGTATSVEWALSWAAPALGLSVHSRPSYLRGSRKQKAYTNVKLNRERHNMEWHFIHSPHVLDTYSVPGIWQGTEHTSMSIIGWMLCLSTWKCMGH